MTEQEKREIVQAVLDAISSKAQDLENVTTLTTLDGVTSLPVLTNGRVVAVVALSALTRNVDAAVASLDTAKAQVRSVITDANNLNAHPMYVDVNDNYVYRWDTEQGAYVKTSAYVKGERGPVGEKGEKGDTGAAGAAGAPGAMGPAGANGNTPQLQISDAGLWEVSYDNGSTFTSLGVSAVGENPDKGLFDSVQTLRTAYPTPIIGWTALVGTATPLTVYKCSTAGVWTDTGMTADVGGIDLSNLVYISD